MQINNKYGFNEKCICISCYKKDNRLKCYETFDKAYTTENYTDFVKLVTETVNKMLDRYLSVV